jgi:hypothetical protein
MKVEENMDAANKYLTSDQLAGLLGISRKALEARVATRLPLLQDAGYIVIEGAELQKFKRDRALHSRAMQLALFPWEAAVLVA